MATRLRDQILAETGLHASFGIATSKTVAKIASDLRKPRGFVVVRPGAEAEFLRPFRSERFPGWARRRPSPSPDWGFAP